MPPIIKDSDSGTLTTAETSAHSGATPARPSDSAAKQQPVALEIPVTVNGARAIEGSDKREPFSESTKTVLVFGSGAVIRLSSPMAPGQLLFVTNERSKREVVCQVVKSKNYRSLSGYVELEFTEPAVGFWGMRFPGDRLAPGQPTAPAAARPAASNGTPGTPRPELQRAEQLSAASAPSSVSAKPSTSAPAPVKPAATPTPAALATSLNDEKLVEPWLKKRSPTSQVTSAKPVAATPQAPSAAPVAAAPQKPAESGSVDASLPVAPTFELTRTSDQAASLFAPSEPPSNLSSVDLSSIAPFFEVKPTAMADAPQTAAPVPTASDAETEELKRHTARLQEQLASMQFAEPASGSPTEVAEKATSAPSVEPALPSLQTSEVHQSPAQVLEDSSAPQPAAVLSEPLEFEKVVPPDPVPSLGSLEQEELKIPAWLEPLARNTAAPSSTQELVPREKTKRRAERPQPEEITADLAVPTEPQPIVETRLPQFGSALPTDEMQDTGKSASEKRGAGMLFGAIAAGVLVAAGAGWWYMNQRSADVHGSIPVAQAQTLSGPAAILPAKQQTAAAPATSVSAPVDSAASRPSPAQGDSAAHVNSGTNFPSSPEANSPATPAGRMEASLKTPSSGPAVTKSSSGSSQPEPIPVEVKKPVLGEVHLAAPKISKSRHAQNGAEPDAGLALNDMPSAADADGLNSSLAISTKEPAAPAAPIAVGGDVKPAKLISSVPPVYPGLAKAQHISGNVTIDALIDASGHVTSMKVISGPTLLQQAAMDALKQWKYQPAKLDGKPVPMHLSVMIQFRLQ